MNESKSLGEGNTKKIATFFAAVFVIDEALLPVFHFGGIPFKLSYLLAFIWLACNIFHVRLFNDIPVSVEKKSNVEKMLKAFWVLIAISLMSELTMFFFSDIADAQPFFDGILYYLQIIGALGLGYSLWKMNPKILIWVLYAYCLLNISLLVAYSFLPGVFKNMYGEYYISGIRIRGTGGNANTTLLVMNMLLMAIVMMVHKDILKVKGFHVWLILIMPLLTNFFISSRGEFIQTVLLEIIYFYFIIKKDRNRMRKVTRIIIILCVLLIAYVIVFKYLYNSNDNIRYGIDRLMKLGELSSEDGTSEEVDTLSRPFFRADVFWDRFKHSPIWGAGYSYGTADDFIKSVNGYHNDWFRILASVGIVGFCIWFKNVRIIVKSIGIYVLLPFLLAGLSNTFLQSTHAFNIYFYAVGYILHHLQVATRKTKNVST